MQTELAPGNNPVENVNKSTESFERVLADSKQKIESTTVTPLTERRGRGRPPLTESQRREREQLKNAGTGTGAPSVDPAMPMPDITSNLIPFVDAIGRIPATRTGIPELALNADESIAVAFSLNQVIQVMFPDLSKIDPKSAALLGLATTVGSIGYSKYAIYLSVKEEMAKAREQTRPPPPGPPIKENAVGGIDPKDYFKNQ